MKKISKLFIAGLFTLSLAACSVSEPVFVTDNGDGGKVGKATYRVIFGIILDGGDGSIKTAAENGRITKISTVDQKVEPGMFVTRYVTVVTGE
ncbi:TRL-like family protein [Bacteroidia bacterium]|nr:TRL-like family protein [Bacteroidia bacterium]MDB9881860.1 TRL-like family protein [Bacteroidia bacterium]